jgi:hypothetical protein
MLGVDRLMYSPNVKEGIVLICSVKQCWTERVTRTVVGSLDHKAAHRGETKDV